jgi:AcrR family transcriptional regulator
MDNEKKYKISKLRIQLIKAASEIISNEGIKKLTMRALSNRVGVSRTAAYRHFENKDALLFAIAEEGFKELTIKYHKINRDKSLNSILRLQNIGLAYIEFAINNPGAFRLMFGREITQHQRSEKLCSIAGKTFNEYLSAVKSFQDEQNTVKEDSILANYYWAIVHGLATLLLDGQIEVLGENYGLPTLLTEKRPNIMGNIQAMIDFSEQTLRNFWK